MDWITFKSGVKWGEDTEAYHDSNALSFSDFGELAGDGLRLKMTGNGLALTIWEFMATFQ
jgi:hypothetical protein